jgi:MFS family permease
LRKAFPAVIGALVCVHASMAATRVTASLLLLHAGYPEWTVGAVAATVVRLAISRWADHLDERRALRCAMAQATVTCVVYLWLPGTAGMVAGSALLGLALGSVQPMTLSMLHQVTPPERHGQALGLRMVATNAATIVMPLGFGLLAALTGPAAPLWLMGSLVLLAQWPASRIRRV